METTVSIGAAGGALAVAILAVTGSALYALIGGGVILLLALVWGAVRRFSRITWIGWQIPLIFGLCLLLSFVPQDLDPVLSSSLYAGVLAGVTALVLGGSGILRYYMNKKRGKPAGGKLAADCIFGAVAAVLAVAMLIVVLGGVALALGGKFGLLEQVLPAQIATNPLVAYLAQNAADLLLISLLLLFMRAGYRLGLLKSLWYILMLGLCGLSVYGCFLLATRVGFGISFSNWIGGLFFKDDAGLASAVGIPSATFVFFLVPFIILMILSRFINLGIYKLTSFKAVGIIDGILVSLVWTAAFCVIVAGVNFGVYALCNNIIDMSALGEAGAAVQEYLHSFEAYITSAPISQAIYGFSPILAGMMG